MIVRLYLACLDHDPPLLSPEPVGQRLSDLGQVRALVEQRVVLALLAEFWTLQPRSPSALAGRFFLQHPLCQIGIIDQSGDRHSTPSIP